MTDYVAAMADESEKPPAGTLIPEGTFVIQLRSDSDVEERRLGGRVEHVMSGESEPFVSLEALLGFMSRFFKRDKANREGGNV